MKKRVLRDLAIVATLLVLHEVLLGWSARRGVAAVLLGAGSHIPLWALAAAAGCLALRLGVILFLPGWIALRIVREVFFKP